MVSTQAYTITVGVQVPVVQIPTSVGAPEAFPFSTQSPPMVAEAVDPDWQPPLAAVLAAVEDASGSSGASGTSGQGNAGGTKNKW